MIALTMAVVGPVVVYPANGILANKSPKPRIPTQAVALLKYLFLNMIAERIKPESHARGIPTYWPPVPSLIAIIACPAERRKDLWASVVADAYWWLRESIEKAVLVARYTAMPTKTKVVATNDQALFDFLRAAYKARDIGPHRLSLIHI